MLRKLPASWAARFRALLSVVLLPSPVLLPSAHAAQPFAPGNTPREHGDAPQASGRSVLPTARWITEDASERRIDVYAFDCARGRYVHVLSERYRGTLRVERVALAEARWSAALQPLPPKYPVLAVHRARSIACAQTGKR